MAHVGAEELSSLAQAARSDRLLIFVGAGISVEYGLPSWHALARDLGNNDFDPMNLPGEFSKFAKRKGAAALNDYLERRLGKRPASAAEATKLLLETRSVAIVTTNADRILETVASRVGAPIKVFVEDDDMVDFYSTPGLRLVKLHGTLDRKSTLTFTTEQYDALAKRIPTTLQTVAHLMSYCQVLFLGYGLSDPDLTQLLQLASNGRPDRMSQMVGLFTQAETGEPWRRLALEDRVRQYAPLQEITYEAFGESPSAGLTEMLRGLRQLVSPEQLPQLSGQTIIFTNGYTATLKTELCDYLANCLGIPLVATHRYGSCTKDGLLNGDLRQRRYSELLSDAENILNRGHSIVLDGTFSDPDWRKHVYDLASRYGTDVLVIRTRCDDIDYIKARLWRRRTDHSRSEHEVVNFNNYRMTLADVIKNPVEQDVDFATVVSGLITFTNEGDRRVEVSEGASPDAAIVADLIRISPLMDVAI